MSVYHNSQRDLNKILRGPFLTTNFLELRQGEIHGYSSSTPSRRSGGPTPEGGHNTGSSIDLLCTPRRENPLSVNKSAHKWNSANFACTEFSEAATEFSHAPCGERDIPDTRRRTVPPPLEPRPASSVVTRQWPVLKPVKTDALSTEARGRVFTVVSLGRLPGVKH